MISGYVVYLYAYDIAYDMRREPIRELLGQPVATFMADVSKHSPQDLFFYRPEMVRLPAVERVGPRGVARVERTLKLLPVGAISITVRVPFEVKRLADLVDFHDLRFSNGALEAEVRRLAEDALRELAPNCIRPVARLQEDEAYTVFCIASPLRGDDGKPLSGAAWMFAHRRGVAALLTQEKDPTRLSEAEVEETSVQHLSYYDRDLTVIDWDAALIADEARNFEEILHILELANVQLAELKEYDRVLDAALGRAYRDVEGGIRFWGGREVTAGLREIRIDMARMADEITNITKFFGDWHLARVYQQLSDRFHLGDWSTTVNHKLKTLGELYELLNQERMNRWMLFLEVCIVLLFVADLALIFVLSH
ncbi:MAG TPA: hypothetical protein DD417_11880 [Elusimicrobia bacterium]|nr:hypothetical protein [Elusimicrobiota bacterium]